MAYGLYKHFMRLFKPSNLFILNEFHIPHEKSALFTSPSTYIFSSQSASCLNLTLYAFDFSYFLRKLFNFQTTVNDVLFNQARQESPGKSKVSNYKGGGSLGLVTVCCFSQTCLAAAIPKRWMFCQRDTAQIKCYARDICKFIHTRKHLKIANNWKENAYEKDHYLHGTVGFDYGRFLQCSCRVVYAC